MKLLFITHFDIECMLSELLKWGFTKAVLKAFDCNTEVAFL